MLHTSLLKKTNVLFYHWYVGINPKTVNDIGFGWDSLYVNPVTSEHVEKFLMVTFGVHSFCKDWWLGRCCWNIA
jgi:hypothetical protein